MAAERLGFEDAHALSLHADTDRPQRGCGLGKGIVVAVAVLPEPRAGLREGLAPFLAFELGDDPANLARVIHHQQGGAFHQMKLQAGEVIEVRPRNQCGRLQSGLAQQFAQPCAAGRKDVGHVVILGWTGWALMSSVSAKRGLTTRVTISNSAWIASVT